MDLSKYSLKDFFLTALKSEEDSRAAYSKSASSVKNVFLKDRLIFLAGEEEKHKIFIEELYRKNYPDVTKIILPKKTPIPIPEMLIYDRDVRLSDVLKSAMNAEMAANEFYSALAEKFTKEPMIKVTLEYFASMELGHYKLLEIEREKSLKFEEYDQYSPMMHVGP